MDVQELLSGYLAIVNEADKNLINIAFDEMKSDQYEEAATHFDQLYVKDANDYMSFFFRAYCKSHCGRRGDVYSDSQKLTSAFDMATKKAIESKKDIDIDISLLVDLYIEGMDNLAYNAVEEVSVDSNGNTHTSNPTRVKINDATRSTIYEFAKSNVDIVKKYNKACNLVVTYLKKIVDFNIELYGPVIVSYDSSYSSIYEEKLSKYKKKNKIKKIFLLAFIIVLAIVVIVSVVK